MASMAQARRPADSPVQAQYAWLVLVTLPVLGDVANFLVRGRAQVQQQHNRQVADVPRDAHIDPRVGHYAAANVDDCAHRGTQVEFLAFLVAPPARDTLRLQRVDQVPDTRGTGLA